MTITVSTNGAVFSTFGQANTTPLTTSDGMTGIIAIMVDRMKNSGLTVVSERFDLDKCNLSRAGRAKASHDDFASTTRKTLQQEWDTQASRAFANGQLGELLVNSRVDVTVHTNNRNKPDMIHVIVARVA